MAYHNKFGITPIEQKRRRNRFSVFDISFESDTDSPNKLNQFPVFLFVPNTKKPADHHHIELTRRGALTLYNWLGEYLKDGI